MRKWCAAAAVGALFVLPLWAQQKDDHSSKPAEEVTAATDAPAASEAPVSARKGIFAVPAIPRPTPFPGPQSAASKDTRDTRPPGKLVPKYEVNAGYSFINFNPGDQTGNFNNHGGVGGFAYNANRVLGLTAEVGGYTFSREVNGGKVDGGLTTYLFGPRLNLRRFDHFVPFAEFLFGGANGGGGVTGADNQNVFAMAAGGGTMGTSPTPRTP